MNTRAYAMYTEIRDAFRANRPFFAAERHVGDARISRNGHGTSYAWPDGSRLFVSRRDKRDALSALYDTNTVKVWEGGLCVAIGAANTGIEPR